MRIETAELTPIQDDAPAVGLQPACCANTKPHAHAELDRFGMWLSAACAVHCAAVPIVLIVFPVFSWIHWSRLMDIIGLSIAAVFGLGGCLLSLRQHHYRRPLVLVIAGLALNTIGRFAGTQLGSYLAQTLIVSGPCLMFYGLWRDRQLYQCKVHSHGV